MVSSEHASTASVTAASVIDIHAHAVLAGSLGAAGAAGPELGERDGVPFYRIGEYVLNGVPYRDSPFMEPDIRIAAMDTHGIDVQLLSPNPLTYFTNFDAATTIGYCRTHNAELAEIVAAHSDRLLGAAQLPMQDLDAAMRELERSVRELGLVAAYIDTDPCRTLDDPAMDEFYACVTELDVPLFVHPTSVGEAGPPDDPRLRRFDLDLLLGFAYSETLAVAALVFGGVLERHPDLDVCVSHGGGAIQTLARRFARAGEKRHWASDRLRSEGFMSFLSRIWFDTHLHSDLALRGLAEQVGTDRLVFGTNFAGWDADSPGEIPIIDGGDLAANARTLLRFAR
jgi:aminocarboxymuconate-semialdehyde decarboxylase